MFFFMGFIIAIALIVWGITSAKQEAQKEKEYELMKSGYNALYRSDISTTTETAKRNYEKFQSEYNSYTYVLSSSARSYCDDTLNELRKNYSIMLGFDVEEKTQDCLDNFIFDYGELTEAMDFSNVDDAYKYKNSCLRSYDRYWETVRKISEKAVDSEQSLVWETAKKNFIERFSSDFNSNLQFWDENGMNKSVREQLVAEIDKCIETLKPEYKRKMKIYDEILSIVRSKESIKRADLLHTPIDNATEEEISLCYKLLVRKGRLFEVKLGSRYFVSLSDKEAKKGLRDIPTKACSAVHDGASNEMTPIERNSEINKGGTECIINSNTYSYSKADFLTYLKEHNIKYVDKSDSGGCLWIEATNHLDQFNGVTVDGKQIRHASTCKQFDNMPAWYIK